MMFEQRTKRSDERATALQYLVEAVLDRSDVRCAALVDESDRIVAGAGMPADLASLARVAKAAAHGNVAAIADGDDVIVREIAVKGGTLVLAAYGQRVRRMPEAVSAVMRICA